MPLLQTAVLLEAINTNRQKDTTVGQKNTHSLLTSIHMTLLSAAV